MNPAKSLNKKGIIGWQTLWIVQLGHYLKYLMKNIYLHVLYMFSID